MIKKAFSFDVHKRHSLALRFIVMVVLILSVTMSTSSYLNYQQQKQQLVKQLILKGEMLGNFVALVSPEAILGYDFVLMEEYMKEIAKREDVLYAAVLSPTGTGLTAYFDDSVEKNLPTTDNKLNILEKVSFINQQPDTLTLNFPINVENEILGVIHIGLTLENINHLTRDALLQNLLQTLAIILTLGIAIYLIFKKRVVNPVSELTTAIKKITDGDFAYRIGTTSKDELGSLARGFDCMSDYLNQSYEELQSKNQELLAATKAKSYFLANMSHEIRTPLTAIIGFSESLLDVDLSSANRKSAIDTIIRNGSYLQKIINDILDISKIEADKLEVEIRATSTVEIFNDVAELIGLQAREKGLNFHINYDYPIPESIRTDALRLKQILINLCSNAIKFTEKGSIYIDVDCSPEHQQLDVTVADTGIGLTDAQVERIFQPFTQADSSTTRQFGGTGLGLTLTRQLVEMLGGTISVQSEFGKGSRFQFSIATGPIRHDNMLMHEPAIEQKPKPQQVDESRINGRVLIVDDNEDNHRLIRFFLSKTPLILTSVYNGMEAVKAVENQAFDLILMDTQMPVLDGIEAIRKVRLKGFDGPVISISAENTPNAETYARRSGCCEMLTKPIDRKKLLAYLHHHLSQQSAPKKTVAKYRGHVLLAEDTPDNQRLVQIMFDKWGVTLSIVEDGQQAVEAALANRYDLILMDMQMPVMSGMEATKKIIEGGCQTPIVALTANALKHDQKTYEDIGCSGFIAKPINREQFEKVLGQYLHREEMSIANPAFKIRRRNSLPDEDTPTAVSVIGQFSEQTQLVAQPPQPKHAPATLETDSGDNNLKNTLTDLANVLNSPLVREFMQNVLNEKVARQSSPGGDSEPQPIYSTIIQDDPDMIEVVRQYVASLDSFKENLNAAIAGKDWDKVARMVHDIKGSGGAFGYPQLSELAKEIDKLLKLKKFNETQELLNHLNATYERILAARF